MRTLLIIISTVLTAATSFAQTNFGVHAGTNVNHIHASYQPGNYSDKSNWNFTIGAFVQMQATKRFAVQPELNFTTYKTDYSTAGKSYAKMSYVQVPVLLKLMTDAGFNLYAGPQLSFLTRAKSKVGNFESTITQSLTQTDFSAVIGGEYISSKGFVFSGRYQYGISNVAKVEISNNFESRLRAFQLTVGYLFGYHRNAVKTIK